MYRLILALGVAGLLLPPEALRQTQNVAQEAGVQLSQNGTEKQEVTTYDAFSAIHSVYYDVTNICSRNEEACSTAKKIAVNSFLAFKDSVAKLTDDKAEKNIEENLDQTKTSTIQK